MSQDDRNVEISLDMSTMFDRDKLPRDADNYDVFCERCQRVHKHYFVTQESYDRVISEGAKKLADAIDADLVAKVFTEAYAASPPPRGEK